MHMISKIKLIKCHCEMFHYVNQALNLLEIHYVDADVYQPSSTEKQCVISCEHQLSLDDITPSDHLESYFIRIESLSTSKLVSKNIVHLNIPFTAITLKSILTRCNNYFTSATEHDELNKELVGESEAINNIRVMIRQVANCDSSVLILGESGTGKEVVASCIHHYSDRKTKPFVPINCGAIPSELMESELFGHEKGAFTGAMAKRIGRFEISNHGTIFLDEIGDMPLSMQVKLLRVLQERKIERVGSTTSHDIDVRVIAATNKNLEEMIKNNTFREDLFYRLNVIPIHVPSLHQRLEDIPLLAMSLIEKISKRIHNQTEFTAEAIQALKDYYWPGNIRELANFIERMVVLYHDRVITQKEIAEELCKHKPAANQQQITLDINNFDGFNLKEYLATIEHQIIQLALNKANGIVSSAAEHLNLRRTTLLEKIKKYSIVGIS